MLNYNPNQFEATLQKVDSILQLNSIDYAVIGGAAAIIYGRLRTTEDIDITLLTEIEDIDQLHKIISNHFSPIFKDSAIFFKNNFVLPVMDDETKVKIDFTAGVSEFDRIVIERKAKKKFGSSLINVCSIEDLILYKLIASRPQDFLDIEDLIKINFDTINTEYMKSMAASFIEAERSDILENLNKYLQHRSKN